MAEGDHQALLAACVLDLVGKEWRLILVAEADDDRELWVGLGAAHALRGRALHGVARHRALVEQARARGRQMDARVTSAEADQEAAQAAVEQADAAYKSATAWVRFRLCMRGSFPASRTRSITVSRS